MRLIGSKMEKEFREELISSHRHHFSKNSDKKLKSVLLENNYSVDDAYILIGFPDESEEHYLVLIDGSFILSVVIEMLYENVAPVIEHVSLQEYKQGLSRMKQVQLLVAQNLAGNKT
ncbi:hypothetical protein [Thalassomonas sp. RHCl1]|uniref:hypothetical protein n=1 Tax=Thalassomonas sp. RHCl1 TaxID=2995320 RepID=UPI00248C7B24|nr:hypothetical protein [Thalassomonas sp. RHCl1]